MTAASAGRTCECGRPARSGKCKRCYNRAWKRAHKETNNNWYRNNPERARELNRKAAERHRIKQYKEETCDILRKHAAEMKDDPEHLTTYFLKKLLKVECEVQE